MKAARQAIRSQAAARDYAERQLAHAQATAQDLNQKLRQARHDKDAATEFARSAIAARTAAERTLAAAEAALAAEKAAREREERALREAHATIRHLRDGLDAAGQDIQKLKAELALKNETLQRAGERAAAALSISPLLPGGIPKRGRGRPRKVTLPLPEIAAVKIAPAPKNVNGQPAKAPVAKKEHAAGQAPVQWWLKGR